MEVKNKIYPSREQMKGFFDEKKDADIDEPIFMVNLLKFREKAEYKDGRETNLSGIEAYKSMQTSLPSTLKSLEEK